MYTTQSIRLLASCNQTSAIKSMRSQFRGSLSMLSYLHRRNTMYVVKYTGACAVGGQIADLEKSMKRLRETFNSSITSFREACYFLFGYSIDMACKPTSTAHSKPAPATFTLTATVSHLGLCIHSELMQKAIACVSCIHRRNRRCRSLFN
jgi:hypothetical protein